MRSCPTGPVSSCRSCPIRCRSPDQPGLRPNRRRRHDGGSAASWWSAGITCWPGLVVKAMNPKAPKRRRRRSPHRPSWNGFAGGPGRAGTGRVERLFPWRMLRGRTFRAGYGPPASVFSPPALGSASRAFGAAADDRQVRHVGVEAVASFQRRGHRSELLDLHVPARPHDSQASGRAPARAARGTPRARRRRASGARSPAPRARPAFDRRSTAWSRVARTDALDQSNAGDMALAPRTAPRGSRGAAASSACPGHAAGRAPRRSPADHGQVPCRRG